MTNHNTIPNEAIEAAARAIENEIDTCPAILADPTTLKRLRSERLGRLAVTAALPHLSASDEGVAVKALEWSEFNPKASKHIHAATPFGVYKINGRGYPTLWTDPIADYVHDAVDIEAAKAAAQEDFNGRIRSALTPANLPGTICAEHAAGGADYSVAFIKTTGRWGIQHRGQTIESRHSEEAARGRADYLNAQTPQASGAPANTDEAAKGGAELYGWKCNCCTTVFTSDQVSRVDNGYDNNGTGPCCPCCKAAGQYTYRYDLHEGDPCKHCGTPHDEVKPGPCTPAQSAASAASGVRTSSEATSGDVAGLLNALGIAVDALQCYAERGGYTDNQGEAFPQDDPHYPGALAQETLERIAALASLDQPEARKTGSADGALREALETARAQLVTLGGDVVEVDGKIVSDGIQAAVLSVIDATLSHSAASTHSQADGAHDLEEALRLAEVGEYLYSARAYSHGDGYTAPREYGIEWQWQQSKPNEYGQGVLLAEAVKWHEEMAADGIITEAAKLRAALSHSAASETSDASTHSPTSGDRKTDAAPEGEVILEHSGCGRGVQVDQITVRLSPGDRVLMVRASAATGKVPATTGEFERGVRAVLELPRYVTTTNPVAAFVVDESGTDNGWIKAIDIRALLPADNRKGGE